MRRLLLAAALALAAGTAWAQVPAGPAFRVNTYLPRQQYRSSSLIHYDGSFTVVWDSNVGDDTFLDLYGQRFAPTGEPVGANFRVNTYTTGTQWYGRIAAIGLDDLVVFHSDQPPAGIYARRYDPSGQPRGPEFRVDTTTVPGMDGLHPNVASDRAGNFVVVWSTFGTGDTDDIFARRFDTNGTPLGLEFRINTYTTGRQHYPAIGMDDAGDFAIFWDSDTSPSDSDLGVYGRVYDRTGAPRGAEFRVNSYTTGWQTGADVAVAGLNMVVTWASLDQDGNNWGVYARRYGIDGTPLGGEFRINQQTMGAQTLPVVATDENFNFVVSWEVGLYGILSRRYDALGSPRGNEFDPSGGRPFAESYPDVSSDRYGNVLSTWSSYENGVDTFAQRWGWIFPAGIQVDPVAVPSTSDGNGVLEPCETAVNVRTSWRNLNGAPQTFNGAVSGLLGPPGATYTVPDPLAAYGTVANGAIASCQAAGDCYVIGVSCAAPRPLPHWDVYMPEDITPLTLGLSKSWALHVGDSFTDVPRSSPYYRFIETLLHNGVTSGCSSTTYCPTTATTREQMAVFVLAARSPGLSPPACTTPLFTDVPASSPFCRWIEELARRGVVSGCGGSFYCPTAAVTREQMAVFTLRTLDPTLDPPACTTPVFGDVPASSPYCKWIEELARRGIVGGCGGGDYCPTAPVTREQMGVFISGTFGLLLY